MTREIKFRAYDEEKKVWICKTLKDLLEWASDGYLQDRDMENVEWQQFTGLHDKNGKEIYKSDKVRILYTNWSSQHLVSEELQKLTLNDYKKAISDNGVIVWMGDRWQVEFDGRFGKEYGSIFPGTHGEIEVIGNLYENSELLNNKN